MPYHDVTGEKSSSQHSLQTVTSEGRRRVLYDDPDSARRKIMGLPASSSQHPTIANTYQDSPLAHRSNENQTTYFCSGQQQPNLPVPFAIPTETETPRSIRIHPNLREHLGLGASNAQDGHGEQYELVSLAGKTKAMTLREDQASQTAPAGTSNGKHLLWYLPCENWLTNIVAQSAKALDRGSSLYPHSQRSNPFDLTVSDYGDDQKYQNIDEIVSVRPSSYFAGGGALYDKEWEEDFAIYEDAPDANAYVSSSCCSRVVNALTRCFC